MRLESLADGLRDAGFTAARAVALLGAEDDADLLSHAALYAYVSAERVDDLLTSPAGVLTQLFVRNGPVRREVYARMLPASLRGLLDEHGLVTPGEGTVAGSVSISPAGSLYFLSDPLFSSDGAIKLSAEPALVMPPHASTFALLHNLGEVRGRLLDVGSGCGVLALSLMDRCSAVTGIDLNPRSVEFSQLNARVNGLRAEFRHAAFGPGFEPAGPADALVFNTPTGPGHRSLAEVGQMTARRALDLVTSATGVLRSGALAYVLLIVEVPADRPSAADLVRGWIPDGWQASATELPGSPLACSRAAMDTGRLAFGSVLAADARDAERLIGRLRARGIAEVMPVLVTLTPPAA
ncbi:methyltransferase [Nonomuraea sp. NPDC050547]|uniref:methyltransferase n=1 Tax=unclassified Nonomuraea TaxID=2593643 RepID=UPI0037899A72